VECQNLIFVEKLGFIDANICKSGFAYDEQGNTYQLVGEKWIKVCCPKREVSLSRSAGSAPMTSRHSVSLVR